MEIKPFIFCLRCTSRPWSRGLH